MLMADQVEYWIQKGNLAHSVYAVAFSCHLRSPLVAKSTLVWEACISAILLGWVVDHQYVYARQINPATHKHQRPRSRAEQIDDKHSCSLLILPAIRASCDTVFGKKQYQPDQEGEKEKTHTS
jgi:hypothetical protein